MNRPSLEIADVFHKYDHLLSGISTDCYKVIRDIKNCRTERLGKHLQKCDECEWTETSYNSCRNRHCPKCQFLKKAKWVDERVQELLPCPYFHVVFTLPAALNPLILRNKRLAYDLLFRASSETLTEVGRRRKNLGATPGFIGVLHTWGQTLVDHPHIHYIVPGGGLNDGKWIPTKRKYLFPVKVLSAVFRGKFLSALEDLYRRNELRFTKQIEGLRDPVLFKSILVESAKKPWIVYAKEPFAGPKQVINYLGQYTHRIAISNYRLIKMEDGKVYFRYRDRKANNKKKVMILDVKEFMRRFLLHVLPKGFVRIRHFGFLASRCKAKNLETLRDILETAISRAEPKTAARATETLCRNRHHTLSELPRAARQKLILKASRFRLSRLPSTSGHPSTSMAKKSKRDCVSFTTSACKLRKRDTSTNISANLFGVSPTELSSQTANRSNSIPIRSGAVNRSFVQVSFLQISA